MESNPWGDSEKRISKFKGQRFDTLAIHGGQEPDAVTGAVMAPIYQNSTYAQRSPGKPYGEFEYSRTHNPTRRMLEDCVALLESGIYGLATSSGMCATALVTTLLSAGDEILCCDDVYGGTYRLFSKVLPSRSLSCKFADLSNAKEVPQILNKISSAKTKMLWVESPTNPLLRVLDIRALAQHCKSKGWLLVVDNTFMSPVFQKPLELGADIVVHSMTKYMGGHSDIVAGVVVTRDPSLAKKLYFNQNSLGYVLPPFDSWLMLRSLKTLSVRMRAHAASALKMAQWLESHKSVERVLYPGLSSHPQHSLAAEQMSGFGGMLSFYLKGGLDEAKNFLQKLTLFTLAESLGGVESLIEHPAIMTHASLPPEIRAASGIGDNFIRVSVGLEDLEDLKADFTQAMK